jgi:hypothetical protein
MTTVPYGTPTEGMGKKKNSEEEDKELSLFKQTFKSLSNM